MQSTTTNEPTELELRARRIADLADRGTRVVRAMVEREPKDGYAIPDPGVVRDAFAELGNALMKEPEKLLQAQMRLWVDHGRIWNEQFARLLGAAPQPVIQPEPSDRRFKDPAWSEGVAYDWLKQSYLLNARWLKEVVAEVEGLDPRTKAKVEFYTGQLIDAFAPSNFAMTNPVAIARAVETGGESLLDGLERLFADLEKTRGSFAPSMAPESAFQIGKDVATTPGKVVFRNELIELIQYGPTTPDVAKRPLLIVPPWINKFYILDLKPKNSFIRFAVSSGLTVFLISWANPDARLQDKSFADYLAEGPLAAMEAIRAQTGAESINLIGYCLGGTLSACLLAHLAARGEAARIASTTLFTCLTDFAEPGDLGVFIDEVQVELLEKHMAKKGYLEARHMNRVFAMLRANDLIWSFAVNNYLLGKEPAAFDLLFWNSDATRMPRMMHAFYLREMYLNNRLIEPGAISLLGTPIDLGAIRTPLFFLSAKEDHIAPWLATYRGSRHFKNAPVRFVLGGSGHIAGVINPADSAKYGYRTDGPDTDDPEAWLAGATEHEGSWWPHWRQWLDAFTDGTVPARDPAKGPLTPLADAPGENVLVRAVD